MPKLDNVFISHSAQDGPIARVLHEELQQHLPDSTFFVASRPGHIATGTEWWGRIQEKLRWASGFVALLTPESITRPWIAFELGAAWYADIPRLMVAAGGLDLADVPEPIKFFQISSLELVDEAAAAFSRWNLVLDDPDGFVERIKSAVDAASPVSSLSGLKIGDRYVAWGGAGLDGLVDYSPEPTPVVILEALKTAGHDCSYGHEHRADSMLGRGARIVYLTDGRKWRRKLQGAGDQILFVYVGGK